MSIAIGGNSVSKMYVGSTEITKAYIGDTLVYGSSEPPVVKDYLKFTALESGTFTLTIPSYVTTSKISSVSYSVDNGNTWVTTNNSDSQDVTITTPTISAGDSVLWKGSGITTANTNVNYSVFSSTGTFNVSGNIMSLLYGDNFASHTSFDSNAMGVNHLFYNCATIVDAGDLVLPTGLVTSCFDSMFYGCTGLTSAPTLSATTLATNCYSSMFRGCTSLTTAPQLLATTLAERCFYYMFRECTSLTSAPSLQASLLAEYCYYGMFQGCTWLTSAPALPATTLASYCYSAMFQGCSALTTAPTLPATTMLTGCYRQMFYNATSLNYIRALFTTSPTTQLNSNMMRSVAATGIYVKNILATWTTTGNNGVPTGWTVIYYDIDEDKYYLDQQKATECDDHGNALQYYYIYRTSSNIIERRSTFKHPTVNFPAIAGNNYCGVFTDYGGKGTIATALANGDPVTFVDDRVWDDGSGYIGESNVSGATLMFDGNNAITTGTTAYTPTVGAIYYVKEVPDWILQRNAYFYPTSQSSTPSNILFLTGIDGTAYRYAALCFKEDSQSEFETINLNVANTVKISNTTLKCYSQFRTKGCITDNTGYICYFDVKSKVEAGKNYIFYFESATPDGIVLHSPVKYKMVVSGTTRRDYTFEEMPFEPITYDSQVEYIELSSDNCNIPIDEYNANTRRFEIDAYIPPTSSDGWLVGSMLADGTKMYAFTPCDENGLSSYKIGSATSPTSLKLEGRYTFSNMANVSECVVTNGTDTITYTSGGTNSANYLPIYLLGLNEGGGGRKTIKGIKLYSAKFYTVGTSATTLVKDLVPVRKDGRGYLYDKVDELQFYAPKGDPITVYGADVVENE